MKVFFSYSHKDERYRKKLDTHLSALKRQNFISGWSDHAIPAGKAFDPEIADNINTAAIILLLISPDFIASDYCFSIELKRAIERHQEGTARVIPVIARPCDWHHLPFGKLKALPDDGKAITLWTPQDKAYHDIAVKLRAVVNELRDSARPAESTTVSPPAGPIPEDPVLLDARLSGKWDTSLLSQIGCPCLVLKLIGKGRRPARISGAKLQVRGPHFLPGFQQAFSSDLGFEAGEPELLDEPCLYIDFHPASRPDAPHGHIIEQGDARAFFIPVYNGGLLDFIEAPPQDVSLVVRHMDGTNETLLCGLEVQRELPGLLRLSLDRPFALHPALVLKMGFSVSARQLPDAPLVPGFLNDQTLKFPPHPRRDLIIDEESDRIRLRAKILRAGGDNDPAAEKWLLGIIRESQDREIRRDAVVALRRLATPRVRDCFLELLKSECNENSREMIIRSFAAIGIEEDLPMLEAMAQDEPSRFCRESAKAVGEILRRRCEKPPETGEQKDLA